MQTTHCHTLRLICTHHNDGGLTATTHCNNTLQLTATHADSTLPHTAFDMYTSQWWWIDKEGYAHSSRQNIHVYVNINNNLHTFGGEMNTRVPDCNCSVLQCVSVRRCGVLQVLQSVGVKLQMPDCNSGVMQCVVAVCCNVLQYVLKSVLAVKIQMPKCNRSVLQCVVCMCCSEVQCVVAVCCGCCSVLTPALLQHISICVAARCSKWCSALQ